MGGFARSRIIRCAAVGRDNLSWIGILAISQWGKSHKEVVIPTVICENAVRLKLFEAQNGNFRLSQILYGLGRNLCWIAAFVLSPQQQSCNNGWSGKDKLLLSCLFMSRFRFSIMRSQHGRRSPFLATGPELMNWIYARDDVSNFGYTGSHIWIRFSKQINRALLLLEISSY